MINPLTRLSKGFSSLWQTYQTKSRFRLFFNIAIFVFIAVAVSGVWNYAFAQATTPTAPSAATGDWSAGSGMWAGLLEMVITGIMYLTKLFISVAVFFLKFFIQIAQYNNYMDAPPVVLGWVMLRDVANMFFVVALLVIAFSTILNLDNYEWQKTFAKLVVAAIFINFSKMILQLIIDIAHVFTITFLNAVSATAAGNLTKMFKLDQLLKVVGDPGNATGNLRFDLFIGAVVALMMAGVTMMLIGAYTLMMVARMVVLWMLMILSPLAFIAQVLPQTKSYADEFWKEFSHHVLVAPVMVFFLWLSFATLGNGDISTTILGSGNQAGAEAVKTAQAMGISVNNPSISLSSGSTWENLGSFIIALGFLYLGIEQVQKLGAKGGNFVGQATDLGKRLGYMFSGYTLGKWGHGHMRDKAHSFGTHVGESLARPFQQYWHAGKPGQLINRFQTGRNRMAQNLEKGKNDADKASVERDLALEKLKDDREGLGEVEYNKRLQGIETSYKQKMDGISAADRPKEEAKFWAKQSGLVKGKDSGGKDIDENEEQFIARAKNQVAEKTGQEALEEVHVDLKMELDEARNHENFKKLSPERQAAALAKIQENYFAKKGVDGKDAIGSARAIAVEKKETEFEEKMLGVKKAHGAVAGMNLGGFGVIGKNLAAAIVQTRGRSEKMLEDARDISEARKKIQEINYSTSSTGIGLKKLRVTSLQAEEEKKASGKKVEKTEKGMKEVIKNGQDTLRTYTQAIAENEARLANSIRRGDEADTARLVKEVKKLKERKGDLEKWLPGISATMSESAGEAERAESAEVRNKAKLEYGKGMEVSVQDFDKTSGKSLFEGQADAQGNKKVYSLNENGQYVDKDDKVATEVVTPKMVTRRVALDAGKEGKTGLQRKVFAMQRAQGIGYEQEITELQEQIKFYRTDEGKKVQKSAFHREETHEEVTGQKKSLFADAKIESSLKSSKALEKSLSDKAVRDRVESMQRSPQEAKQLINQKNQLESLRGLTRAIVGVDEHTEEVAKEIQKLQEELTTKRAAVAQKQSAIDGYVAQRDKPATTDDQKKEWNKKIVEAQASKQELDNDAVVIEKKVGDAKKKEEFTLKSPQSVISDASLKNLVLGLGMALDDVNNPQAVAQLVEDQSNIAGLEKLFGAGVKDTDIKGQKQLVLELAEALKKTDENRINIGKLQNLDGVNSEMSKLSKATAAAFEKAEKEIIDELSKKDAGISAALATALSRDKDISASGFGEMLNENVMRRILDAKGMVGMPSTAFVDMINKRMTPFRDQTDVNVLKGMLDQLGKKIGAKWGTPGYENSNEQVEDTVNAGVVMTLVSKNGFVDDAMQKLTAGIVAAMGERGQEKGVKEAVEKSVREAQKKADTAVRRNGGGQFNVRLKLDEMKTPNKRNTFQSIVDRVAKKASYGGAAELLDSSNVEAMQKARIALTNLLSEDVGLKRELESQLGITGEQIIDMINELRLNMPTREGLY